MCFYPVTGTTEPVGYTRFAVDNIDINEETLSGMGTFHATQVAAFRRKEEGEPAVDIEVRKATGSTSAIGTS